ncbi:MAG: YihY/virulence factor BrkB family protein [Actinomycetota bacterium]
MGWFTGGLSPQEFLKQTLRQGRENHLSAFAGHLTYLGLFAIFPLLVLLLSLVGIFSAERLVGALLDSASAVMPAEAVDLLGGPILAITRNEAKTAFTLGAIIAIAAALWALSGAFRGIMQALNVVHGVEESRPFWKKYLISVALAGAVVLLMISAGVLVVFGGLISEAVARATGLGAALVWSWKLGQWPLLVAFILLALGLIYHFGPDVKQPRRLVTPGAIIALAGWLAFSLLFSIYVNNFGKYNATYGALAGLAILMLLIYNSSYIVLLGAQINHVVEGEGRTEPRKYSRIRGAGQTT